jgi:hypothetical protein
LRSCGEHRYAEADGRGHVLRRTFDVDVLDCANCHGRLRVAATIADMREARCILERLGVPSDAPQAARVRDPTCFDDEQHASP